MGYTVSRRSGGHRLYVAERQDCTLQAEDILSLLALATIYEERGAFWRPSDDEIAAYLNLEGGDA
ncbi:hypothetical protein ASC76_10415 [Rhizobacter sp. Root404]|nr:hypothetical protein ASC76_10415 [Rhizobacter sp. Root404]